MNIARRGTHRTRPGELVDGSADARVAEAARVAVLAAVDEILRVTR